MSLKPCRACQNEVDTSAISCPNCGATRPAHALSLQTYNLIILAIQIIVGLTILYFIASAVWQKAEPYMMKYGIMQHQQQQQQLKSETPKVESVESETDSEAESETESENDSDNENTE